MGGKTQQTSQQVTIPPAVLAQYQSVNANADKAAQTPFQQYSTDPNAFVAPINSQQQTGIAGVNSYANAAQPAIAGGEALTMAGAGPVNPTALDANAIQQYENPYTSYVTNQMSQLMNQQNQQAQAGQLGNAITSGAFGGDRAGLGAANLAQQQEIAYGNVMAPILQQGYNTALSTAQQQQSVGLAAGQANAGRLTQAGAQLAGLGQAGQTAGLAGAQAQTAAGTLEQQTQQAGQTALYNQFLQQQSYPFQTAQFLANIAEGTGALSGQTTNTTSPAPFFSDRKLKENIKQIGRAKNGLPIYSFNYKDDPEKLTRLGFMADEVEKKHPDAVGLAGGYKTVDYDEAVRPKRYAGGLVAGSDMGRGFDAGGATSPAEWTSMLASHEGMYGPQAGGLYGGAGPGAIPGGGHSYVPAANLPQHQMLRPGSAPAPQPSTLAQLAQVGNQIKTFEGAPKGLQDAYEAAKKGWAGLNPPQAAAPPPVQPATDPSSSAATGTGGLYARGGLVDNGDPEGLYLSPGGIDIPNEHSDLRLPSSSSSNSSSPSGLSQLAGLGSTVSGLSTLGGAASSGLSSALSALGPLFMLNSGGAVDPEFARGGLAGGGEPTDDDAIAAQDALDSARQFSGGLNPRKDLAASRHLQPDAPAPEASPYGDLPIVRPSGVPTAPITGQFNVADVAAGEAAKRASGLGAAEATPEVPTPPRRPAGLGAADPVVAEAPAAPAAPGLAAAAPRPAPPLPVGGRDAQSPAVLHHYEGWTPPTKAEVYAEAARVAQAHGIDPELMQAFVQKESNGLIDNIGDGGSSHGVIQAHFGGVNPSMSHAGLGDDMLKAGIDARDPRTWQQQLEYAANHIANSGWGAWKTTMGKLGVGAWDGINGAPVGGSALAAVQRVGGGASSGLPANASAYSSGAPQGGLVAKGAAPDAAAAPGGDGVDDFGANVTHAGQQVGNWFEGNKNWMIPLLTGLGTMASSNSRYLGSAMLQGLGGGAQAYAQQQANQAAIGDTQAHTLLTGANTANINAGTEARLLENFQHTSFMDPATKQPMKTVIMPDGSRRNVTFAEYKQLISSGQQVRDANPATDFQPGQAASVPTGAPALGAAPIAAVPGAPVTVPGASAPVGGAFASAPSGAPQTHIPAPPMPPAPVGVNFGDVSQGYAARENRWDPYNQAGVAQGDEDAIKVQKEAEAARGQVQYAQKLMNTVADAGQGKLGNVAGAGANDRAQLINLGNTAANAFGLGPNYFGDLPDQATIMNKLNTLRAAAQAHGGNLEAYAALESLKNANPNIEMPREAMASLTAQVLADQQRVIDRADHMERYKQSGAESTAYAAKAFNEENGSGKYNREAAALQKLILSQPKVLHTLTSGKYTDKAQIEEYLQKKLGAPPGLSRYFVSGGG